MGDSLKEAGIFAGARELAKRVGSPLKGLTRGWESLSPSGLLRQGGPQGEALANSINRTGAAEKALQTSGKVTARLTNDEPMKGLFGREVSYSGASLPGRARAQLASHLRAGTHLSPDHQAASGVKGIAERASRAGWTGEGRITKYAPIGQKSMLVAGTMAAMPGIVNAVRYGPSEQFGGVGEQTGSLLGYTAPAILAGGMPNASFLLPILGGFAGGRMGRALDSTLDPRVRSMERAKE